ncbi:MAG: hypothetical protein AAF615_00800 [Pseudomonadota bacterium]
MGSATLVDDAQMVGRKGVRAGAGGADRPPEPPRDLVDFHLRWAEFRPLADSAMSNRTLSREERETIKWLVILADRVSARDITEDPH